MQQQTEDTARHTPVPAIIPDPVAWETAMAELEQAQAAYEIADAEDDRIAALYWTEVNAIPDCVEQKHGMGSGTMSAANRRDVSMAYRALVAVYDDSVKAQYQPYLDACRRIVDHAVLRQRKIAEIDQRFGYSIASEHLDQTIRVLSARESTLIQMPAPDRTALLWKIEKLLTIEDDSTSPWCGGYVSQTLADARRLLGN